jgi:arylsulfatase
VKQLPIDGISMTYTWEDANAPTRRATQLFEMFGNRGIYHDGWMASTTPLVFAWEPEPKGVTPESFNWELYDLHKDFSQGIDLAKAMPEKLRQMEDLWWAEAGSNNALPLNFSPQATVEAIFQKPSLTRGRSHFVYHQDTVRIPEGTAPTVKNASITITARLNCSATIWMRNVLPHPGMLPNGSGTASPECSRRCVTLSTRNARDPAHAGASCLGLLSSDGR